jgi:hypothetical protein
LAYDEGVHDVDGESDAVDGSLGLVLIQNAQNDGHRFLVQAEKKMNND